MSRKVNTTPFKDRNSLNKLVNLRIFGFSRNSLAILFNVDKTALTYHFKKYGIAMDNVRRNKQSEVYDVPRIVSHIVLIPPSVWVEIDGERINQGRSYAEYLTLSPRSKTLKG